MGFCLPFQALRNMLDILTEEKCPSLPTRRKLATEKWARAVSFPAVIMRRGFSSREDEGAALAFLWQG